jgi:hypothetical protein
VLIKACLVSIVVLLTAILMIQHSEKIVHAQGRIQYKVVEVDFHGDKYLSTQDALNEYGKNGWELVSASYREDGQRSGRLIFMRK